MPKTRRAFLKSTSLLSLGMLGSLRNPAQASARSGQSGAEQIVRGIVYLDRDGDGRRGPSDPGLPGVRVSNGVDIAVTDERGRYELSFDDEGIVFVLKPRGYMSALDHNNLPQFYYVHRPEGSPDEGYAHKGVEPTGPLPASVDFPLLEQPEPDKFDMVFVADPQPRNMDELGYYARDIVAELRKLDVAFGLVVGDVVFDNPALFGPITQLHGTTGYPWYHAIGNHDLNFEASDWRYCAESYIRHFGPRDYAFQYGPAHFIVLDNVNWLGNTYNGGLRREQLRFVSNYLETLAGDELVIVNTHIPMTFQGSMEHRHATAQCRELMQMLSRFPNSASISGHLHTNQSQLLDERYGFDPGGGRKHLHNSILTGAGDWWNGPLDEEGIPMTMQRDGTPNGYAIGSIDGNRFKLRFRHTRRPEDYQMRIHAPAQLRRAEIRRTVIHVNVFNGTEATRVRMRVIGEQSNPRWVDMRQTRLVDPVYEALHERSDRQMTAPSATDHMWHAPLPQPVGIGGQMIEVEATDIYGTVDRAYCAMRVMA